MTESISQEMMFKYSLPGLGEGETEKQDVRCKSYHIMIVKRWQMFDWSLPVCCHLVQYPGEGKVTPTWRHDGHILRPPNFATFQAGVYLINYLHLGPVYASTHRRLCAENNTPTSDTRRYMMRWKGQKFSIKPTTTLNKTLELID